MRLMQFGQSLSIRDAIKVMISIVKAFAGLTKAIGHSSILWLKIN